MICKRAAAADIVRARANASPDKTAFIFEEKQYTWREVDNCSDRIALYLHALGVRKNDKIALWGVNSTDWILCFFGIVKIGGIAVLLNYNYRDCELSSTLEQTDVSVLLSGEARKGIDPREMISRVSPRLPQLKNVLSMCDVVPADRSPVTADEAALLHDLSGSVAPDDVACIIFSSGTTARPKGIQLMHHNLVNNAAAICSRMQWSENDRQAIVLPFFHGSGMVPGIMCTIYAGMSAVILRCFQSGALLRAIQDYRCTVVNAVPSMLIIMMNNKDFSSYDISSFSSGIISGSTILPESFVRICSTVKADHLQMAYGQTETSPLITISPLDDDIGTKAVTVGTAIDDIPIRIWNEAEDRICAADEQGEIQVCGDTIMKGYYGQPELTASHYTKDGWWKTDDIGSFDKNHRLHFCTRKGDMIIRGGENISPREIEECITRYSDRITEVKVVGIPSEIVQEEVGALLVTVNDCRVDPEGLRAFLRKRIADYKIPKYIFQLDGFPMTSNGKPDSKKLKQIAAQMAKQSDKNIF